MQYRFRRSAYVTAVAAVTALVAAGCGGSSSGGGGGQTKGDTTGVTDTSVLVGATDPLTGPAAPGYSEIAPAAQAYFNYVNDNGGINGRKITYKYVDDGYNPANTVAKTRQLVLQDKVFAMLGALGTPTHTKVVDYLNTSKVPDFGVASGCLCWDQPKTHPYTYGWQPDYFLEGKILGNYVNTKYAGKKVALFIQNDDFGQDGARGVAKYVKAVTTQTYQPGNTDITPQITALAGAKPDVIISFSIPAYTALLKLGTLKANIHPTIVVSNVGSDPVTLSGLLENFAKQGGATVNGNALLEGLVSDAYLPAYLGPDAANNSWIQLYKKVHDKYVPKLPFDGNVVYGMSLAYTFTQLLQKAGKDLTREKLLAAINAGGLTGGPGLAPYRYSANSHAGATGVQVTQFTNGAPVPQGAVQTTDDADGPITDVSGSPATAPANGIPAP